MLFEVIFGAEAKISRSGYGLCDQTSINGKNQRTVKKKYSQRSRNNARSGSLRRGQVCLCFTAQKLVIIFFFFRVQELPNERNLLNKSCSRSWHGKFRRNRFHIDRYFYSQADCGPVTFLHIRGSACYVRFAYISAPGIDPNSMQPLAISHIHRSRGTGASKQKEHLCSKSKSASIELLPY